MSRPRVILHLAQNGDPVIYVDGDIDLFWVDEGCPDERVYQEPIKSTPEMVDRILDGFDPQAANLARIRAEIAGKRH